MNRSTYSGQLKELLTNKVKQHGADMMFIEHHATHGYVWELWGTIEENEIDARYFIVGPGMQIIHAYLSDFQTVMRDRDKVITDVVEGTIFGQALYMFRIIMASIGSQLKADVTPADQVDQILPNVLEGLGRRYRHVLLFDGKLVSGEVINPLRPLEDEQAEASEDGPE